MNIQFFALSVRTFCGQTFSPASIPAGNNFHDSPDFRYGFLKIFASPHPFLPHSQRLFAPDSIEKIFAEGDIPADSWHAGFSRTGDFLYLSDNLPFPWSGVPTLRGIDAFFQALESFTFHGDLPFLHEFRTTSRIEPKADILLRINRKDLTLPPRVAISSRKEGDILHFGFLPAESRGTDFDRIGSKSFFVRARQTLTAIAGWLEQIDEETLGIVGAGVFRQNYREEESDVLIRSLRGGVLLKTTKRSEDQLPGLASDIWRMPRWWGSRIEDTFDPQSIWVHTVLHCARGLPVLTVSAHTDFIRKTGISRFRSTLQKMSGQILECSRVFSWGERFRYARHWLTPAGFDIRQADRILGMFPPEKASACILIPVRASLQDLKEISRKTRMNEPIFWDSQEEQVWVTLQDVTLDSAENVVRPSLIDRLGRLVGSPIPAGLFLERYEK